MQALIIILLAGILYLSQAVYFAKHWTDSLTANISYSKTHAGIGEPVELFIDVTNKKHLPLPVLYVKFKTSRTFLYKTTENSAISDHYYRNDVFSILGNQQVKRSLTFTTTKRGYFTIDTVNLVINDMFFRHPEGHNLSNHCALYVFPDILCGRKELLLTKALIGDILTKNLYADPLSFRGIRDYTPSDEMRYINWKSSAKHQKLMVNTYFDTQTTSVVLIANFDTHTMIHADKMREYIVRVCATLIESMNKQHFSLQLLSNAPDIITNLPVTTKMGSGNEHTKTLYEALARVNVTKELGNILDYFKGSQSVFTGQMSGVSYVIVSNYRKQDLLLAYHARQQEGYSMYFVCPDKPDNFAKNEFYIKQSTAIKDDSKHQHLLLRNIHLWEVSPDEV